MSLPSNNDMAITASIACVAVALSDSMSESKIPSSMIITSSKNSAISRALLIEADCTSDARKKSPTIATSLEYVSPGWGQPESEYPRSAPSVPNASAYGPSDAQPPNAPSAATTVPTSPVSPTLTPTNGASDPTPNSRLVCG